MHTSYLQRKIFYISKSADTTYSILFYVISSFEQKYVSKLCVYCQFALFQVKLFPVTMVLDMQIQNLIYFNTILFRSTIFLSIQFLFILFCFVIFKQKYVLKLCQYLNYSRFNFLSPPWS